MEILVVGANGQIGKHLVKLIQKNDNLQAKAMIRNEEQASFFKDLGAELSIVDLEQDVDAITNAAKGVDAVVFTAGSGGHTGKDKTMMVDLDGAVKTIEAAKNANVKRFIMISSFDTRREAIQTASSSFAPYVAAKHYADEWLRNSNLDYTIIHPGLLTNDEGTGQVELGSNVERGEVPREDIASVIASSLENDTTIGKEFQVVSGTKSIKEALNALS
ncbi:SDR family oxidoreductase [Virgibacillus sp. NKC19-3]|uniref:SDR family oxidoreductase n=1 Tax=Virgibacillus saliphilus TaxID=2831674 RepID=UPI001C9BA0C0|nr:SDR family oxidoreductase [Virgibacillus sp. NKC19-3]MBY7142221.1 SDR family oxidoreductase [Virgibacillus sp. NKC19-3]